MECCLCHVIKDQRGSKSHFDHLYTSLQFTVKLHIFLTRLEKIKTHNCFLPFLWQKLSSEMWFLLPAFPAWLKKAKKTWCLKNPWGVASNTYRHLDSCKLFSGYDRLQAKPRACYPIWGKLVLNTCLRHHDQMTNDNYFLAVSLCYILSLKYVPSQTWFMAIGLFKLKRRERQHCVFICKLWHHM